MSTKPDFVHLHLHSQYSLLEGAILVDQLAELLIAKSMTACALTDHGNLFGAIEFYKALRARKLKPILGQGFLMGAESLEKKPAPLQRSQSSVVDQGQNTLENGLDSSSKNQPSLDLTLSSHFSNFSGFPINLLCLDQAGYQNLIQLSSLAYAYGDDRRKSFLPFSLLETYHAGLILTLPGKKSALAAVLKEQGPKAAAELLTRYQEVFQGRVYLEIIPEQGKAKTPINEALLAFAAENNLEAFASNDSFYAEKQDAYAHYLLTLIGKQQTIQNADPFRDQELYVKDYAEMERSFQGLPPSLLSLPSQIAANCEIDLEWKCYYLPKIEKQGKEESDFFHEEVAEGFAKKFALQAEIHDWDEPTTAAKRQEYEERLLFEQKVIESMGYRGYFLIVADFIQWAKQNGVYVGPGRGSGAGSLVAYSLDITDINPIEYGLLFERFLNPERVSLPDFDIDFDTDGRERVIDYVRQKYGSDHVSQISTLGTLQARAAIRGVGRALALQYRDVDRLAKLIPNELNITLDKAIEKSEPLQQAWLSGSDEEKAILHNAKKLEGLSSNLSTHAAGVVIMSTPITNILPVCLNTEHTSWQTQYSMEGIESQGAIKFDFLGLTTLSILKESVELIERQQGKKVSLNSLPLEDPAVYKSLSGGLTTGVFQLESRGMKRFIKRFRPKRFEDLIALLAVFRPGPLQAKMDKTFVDRKDGREKVEYQHPLLEEILHSTYGVIIYQEQIMLIAQRLGGYSLGKADLLRRAIGKKKAKELLEQEEEFVKGVQASGASEAVAKDLFSKINEFANYGFNKSHAAAYGLISYQTAYLKHYYPLEFFTALLRYNTGNYKQIFSILVEWKKLQKPFYPPDVQKSLTHFSIEGKGIRYGLLDVKNVGKHTVEHLLELRNEKQGFASLQDFYASLDPKMISSRCLESLIEVGAFDCLEPDRQSHLANLESIMRELQEKKRKLDKNQLSIFDGGYSEDKPFSLLLKQAEYSTEQDQQVFLKEFELLGFPCLQTCLDDLQKDSASLRQTLRLKTLSDIQQEMLHQEEQQEKKRSYASAEHWSLARILLVDVRMIEGRFSGNLLLEDKDQVLEFFLEHDLIVEKKHLLTQGACVLVKLQQKGQQFRLQDVKDWQSLKENHATQLDLLLPAIEQEQLVALKKIVERHQGKAKLSLIFRLKESNSQARVVTDEKITIKPSLKFFLELKQQRIDFLTRFIYQELPL